MVIVSATDFTNVCNDIGETVIIYAPTQTNSTDYGSIATSTLGDGTSETAIVQPMEEGELITHQGHIVFGDLFMMFISTSVIAKDSLLKVSATSKYYRVVFLEEIRPGGTVHHYEAHMRRVE